MSTWYKTGNVSVTNGSVTVTGSGTAWVANVRIGDEFRLSGGQRGYEIVAINSDTQLTISPGYLDSTQSGQSYVIVPTKGILKKTYDALSAALATIQGHINGPLSGLFGAGTPGAPGLANVADTNTGFFWPAENQLAAATNGIRRLLLSSTAMQVDVPITGSAVQSSSTDTTAGRLMAVGAFGLGGASGGDVDCNATGLVQRMARFTANTPDGGSWHGVHLNRALNAQAGQIAIKDDGTGASRLAFRHRTSGGVWQDWNEVFGKRNILGTVSQASGTPTGAIIERGSNANGEYVRFADGTQICTNNNAAITTAPAAFVGTITKIDSNKLWIGRWY